MYDTSSRLYGWWGIPYRSTVRLRSSKFLESSFDRYSDDSSLSDFSMDDLRQRLSRSSNETTVASSASEERLLRVLFFRLNLNELLRSQSRFLS